MTPETTRSILTRANGAHIQRGGPPRRLELLTIYGVKSVNLGRTSFAMLYKRAPPLQKGEAMKRCVAPARFCLAAFQSKN
jgi:hypothetical protein